MKPLTHCEQTLQIHRSVQNEFPWFSCRCRNDSFFLRIRRSVSDSTMLPSYGRYLQPQDPSGGILLAEQGGAPPRFHTENALASVTHSDAWIGREGPSPWTPYHQLWHLQILVSRSPWSVFVWFVWMSEQTAIISVYSINWFVIITETESFYCAVRTKCITMTQVYLSLSVTILAFSFHTLSFLYC